MMRTDELIPEAGNLENFIKHFPVFAKAPESINQFRNIILQFALMGKLVENSSENSIELARDISTIKENMINKKVIKKSKAMGPISKDEIKFSIPNNWGWYRASEIFDIRDGTHDSPKYQDNGYPLVTSKNIYSGKLELDNVKYISEVDHKKISERSKVDKGDILFAMIGSIGNPVIIDINPEFSVKNVGLFKYYDIEKSLPKFLLLFLKFSSVWMKEEASGAVQSFVSLGKLRSIPFPLPPLEEQKRIVAKVDELMALVDKLEAQQQAQANTVLQANAAAINTLLNPSEGESFDDSWDRIASHFNTLYGCTLPMPKGEGRKKKHLVGLENVRALRRAILAFALSGKLTHKSSYDEDVDKLLSRIDHKKEFLIKEKAIKKQKQIVFNHDNFNLDSYPLHWNIISLQRIITVMDAGWSPACPPEPSPSDEVWGILKTTAVQTLQYQQEANKVLAPTKEPKPQYEVHVGDILITRAGPKNRVGISCLVEKTRPRLMISDKIIRFHLVEAGLSEQYISLCLNAGITAEHLDNSKSGMAESQMNISQDKLKAAPIPLPPKEEQERIVAKVDELMHICDKLEEQLTEAYSDAETLMKATVKSLVA